MKNNESKFYKLDKSGFVTTYLYAGRKESKVLDDHTDNNQLRYEKYLRGQVVNEGLEVMPQKMIIGEESPNGMPWQYYYSHNNGFLELSHFYLEPRRVDVLAVTELVVEEPTEVTAMIYSCSAVKLWLNGEESGIIERPVYKPIQSVKVTWQLKKGRNRIIGKLATVGVRDTRISLGIKLVSGYENVMTGYPEESLSGAYELAAELLNETQLCDHQLVYPDVMPAGSNIVYKTGNYDFRRKDKHTVIEEIAGEKVTTLKDFATFRVTLTVGNQVIGREFERMSLQKPTYVISKEDDQRESYFKTLGEIKSITRGENDGFAMYPLLARFYFGERTDEDLMEIDTTLDQIARRMDCADFMTCGFVRFLYTYPLDEVREKKLKETMLSFRYWMDQPGQDGMCFWSENHSLMFYQTAYFFGKRYPEDVFEKSGKTGALLAEDARTLIEAWLVDLLEYGFDEFNSGDYTTITFSALLNLVDYAEKDLADMAKDACDLLVRTAMVHYFKGVLISPQGRIYRSVLYPSQQAIQALVHYIDGKAPYAYSEWLIALATSRYEMPEDIQLLMDKKGHHQYEVSNAVVDLYKTYDYMMTSVQSPRADGKGRSWQWSMDEAKSHTHHYTKSLNECFHGTMAFEPGVLGYQQHLWYAALDAQQVIFTTHPGGTCEYMPQVRPGYWYGNGRTPAIKQQDQLIGIVYSIPEEDPIHFTHAFWYQDGFDETFEKGHWIFGRKNQSYIALWCSGEMENVDDVLFGCEKRTYGRDIAYLCLCSSQQEDGTFKAFQERCHRMEIVFGNKTLTCEALSLTHVGSEQKNQYVD